MKNNIQFSAIGSINDISLDGECVFCTTYENEDLDNPMNIVFSSKDFITPYKVDDWFVLRKFKNKIEIEITHSERYTKEDDECEYQRLMRTLPDFF